MQIKTLEFLHSPADHNTVIFMYVIFNCKQCINYANNNLSLEKLIIFSSYQRHSGRRHVYVGMFQKVLALEDGML